MGMALRTWEKAKEADDEGTLQAQPPTITLADVQEAIRSKADETLGTFPPGSTMASTGTIV